MKKGMRCVFSGFSLFYTIFVPPSHPESSNGGSIPPRLRFLSSILRTLQHDSSQTEYALIALSYRRRPSERDININAQAAIKYAMTHYSPDRLILWGQSLGAGVACSAARPHSDLLLETPFVNVRAMLLALYPQKWLPYRYLGPFFTESLG